MGGGAAAMGFLCMYDQRKTLGRLEGGGGGGGGG